MIRLSIPENFVQERIYILSVLLEDFLGLKITISVDDVSDYFIYLPNGKQLVVKDHFFSHINDDTFLDVRNLPQAPVFLKSKYAVKSDMPILYGGNRIEKHDQTIIVDADIFASAFFLLVRWEMIVTDKKDQHGRMPDELMYLRIHNLHYRAVVNEYSEFLWNVLIALDASLIRKQFDYQAIVTHDIDILERYPSWKLFLRALAGDLLKRYNPLLWFITSYDFFTAKLGIKKDVYNTFDYLMDVSEKNCLKSHFYFIPGVDGETDVRYDITGKKASEIISNIKDRGHIIGLHGTYDAYNKPDRFSQELLRLKNIHSEIHEGRQHYLRFENPLTWQMWENEGLKIDSTMSYSNDVGFATGCCYEYHPFNVITRKKMEIIERPVSFMETALMNKQCSDEEMINRLKQLHQEIKLFKGSFVLLWHNSNIFKAGRGNYRKLYEEIINSIHE